MSCPVPYNVQHCLALCATSRYAARYADRYTELGNTPLSIKINRFRVYGLSSQGQICRFQIPVKKGKGPAAFRSPSRRGKGLQI
eukprot:1154472-Pelagomonas_calceolata.AAC.7